MKKSYLCLFIFVLLVTTTSTVLAQYSAKKIEISNDMYYGTVEVCEGCKPVKALAERTYIGVENNELQVSEGIVKGQLLHGTAKLFFKSNKKPYLDASFFGGQYHKQCKEWTEDGEFVMNTEYSKGVKNGKSVNYVFGNVETEDTFANGRLKSTTYFDPESKKANYKIEILSTSGNTRRTKATYYGALNTLEVERKEVVDNGQVVSVYYDGSFINKNKAPGQQLIEKGTYKMNHKVGTWIRTYKDGVKATTEYDYDQIKSEKFTKDGKPFTGEAFFVVYYPRLKKNKWQKYGKIQVKNGLRDGNSTVLWGKNIAVVKYTNGKPSVSKSFGAFLKGKKVIKEYTLSKQCDGRGKGLYVEKIQVTDQYTVVYCHYTNVILTSGAGLGTPAPGQKDGFTMTDVKTKKVNKLKRTFFIQDDNARSFVYYGEMINFVLVFDKLDDVTKTVSFIEGEEAYVVNSDGSDLYKWGCYDLKLK